MLKTDAKIMLVDDSALIRRAMTRILNELGYTNIIEAPDGAQAVEKHAAETPDFIFMDVVMPNMNGDEALAVIRSKDDETPIAMLSSVAKQSEIDACKALGIVDFLIKPLTHDDGKRIVTDVFSRV